MCTYILWYLHKCVIYIKDKNWPFFLVMMMIDIFSEVEKTTEPTKQQGRFLVEGKNMMIRPKGWMMAIYKDQNRQPFFFVWPKKSKIKHTMWLPSWSHDVKYKEIMTNHFSLQIKSRFEFCDKSLFIII